MIDTTKPDWDIEVKTLMEMLDHGLWAPHEVATIQRQIADRRAQLLSGLGSTNQLYWTMRVQSDVDSLSRVRRDPIHGWMLDRWDDNQACWHPVGYIGSNGRAIQIEIHGVPTIVVAGDQVRSDLIQFLKDHDMQRPGYIEEKENRSKAIRTENERLAREKVLAAVDSLSEKRIKEFVSVEKAIQTGETVTMHGKSMEMFEKMTEAGKQAPEGPTSLNPGVHPLRHRRDYSKGEGESYVKGSKNRG